MENRGGKIFEYLRANSNLDLEIPDIAFNVRKSEKTVEAALLKLQQQGLVTARQNEFGRVYWYALPSAPITKTLKLVEDTPLEAGNGLDEEGTAAARNAGKTAASLQQRKKERGSAPVGRPKEPGLFSKKTASRKNSTISPSFFSRPAPLVVPPPETTSILPSSASNLDDLSDVGPQRPSLASVNSTHAGGVSQVTSSRTIEPGAVTPKALAIGVAVAILIALLAFIAGMGAWGRVTALKTTIANNYVTVEELSELRDKADKSDQLEAKVKTLSSQVENLKRQQGGPASSPGPVKNNTAKGFYGTR